MIDKVTVCLLLLGVFRYSNSQCTQSLTTASGTHAPSEICSGDLIFNDEFDELNFDVWNHERTLGGGGNWEFQWYDNSRYNSYVENSVLHIRPTLVDDEWGVDAAYTLSIDLNGGSPADECTNPAWYGCARTGTADAAFNPVKSARIRTVYSFAFKYGKVEIKAKVPAGDWLWPALWMLPKSNAYSGWPTSGEIDIMESRGNKDYVSPSGGQLGPKHVGQTLHWGPRWDINRYDMTTYAAEHPDGFDLDFHLYQLEWNPDQLIFKVDNTVVGTVTPPDGGFWQMGDLDSSGLDNPWKRATKMAPFDQEFYLIINLAVGGLNYFPDDGINGNGPKPWTNDGPNPFTNFYKARDGQWLPTWNRDTDQSHFQVDYVKVWAL